MKKLIIFLCFMKLSFFKAQTFGNEWINYNQTYYSFPIVQSGIYKLDYAALQASGVPVGNFQSANIQLFGKEKEVPILVEDGGDNQLNNGDYILFYAERNDGWLDSTLYDDPSWLGNPKYSLYNDTIQYFFTWNNQTNNKRIQIQTDVNVNAYTPSDFVLFERSAWFNERYNEGEKTSDASSSYYVHGEGWGIAPLNGVNAVPQRWNFSNTQLENIYQASNAPNVQYSAVIVGSSNAFFGSGLGNHHTRHTIGNSNFVLFDSIFSGYKSVYVNKSFPVSVLPSQGNSNFIVSIINDLGVATDFQSINFWSFKYPRIPTFNNATSTTFSILNSSTASKIRLNLSSINVQNPVAFSVGSSVNRIPLIQSSGQWQCLIPNDIQGIEQKVVIQDFNALNTVQLLKAVNNTGQFVNYGSNVNLENALLFIYPKKLSNKAMEYADYRSSAAGGSYNVIRAQVEELYQQFGGGIPKHINGIRRFAHYVYENSTQKPVGLFLVGKGIREANITSATNIGPGSRTNSLVYQNNLIPSFGQPSCDQCITSNLENYDKYAPLIPTGRISVQTEEELQIYLSKVIEYEEQQQQNSVYTTETKDWQKQILHFSGGGNSSEQQLFQNYLNNMGEIAENEYFAGNVTLVAKDSDDPISPTELEVIKQRIEDGVSVMNFFGHFSTSESGFDVNIDEPQNWGNQSKYPVLIANSCYNGNIFHNSSSNSQSFTLIPNAGVIAYIGTINYGFTSSLYQYSTNFYKQFSQYNYGGTIGEHIKNSIDSSLTTSSSLLTEATFCQMTLNGDPMLKINYHNKPEIELTESRVSFGPSSISLATDSIQVNINLRNLGKSILDTFNLQITRDFPNSNVDSNYFYLIEGLDYQKNISLKLPLQPEIGIGQNQFSIKVDWPSQIEEQFDETVNNSVIRNFLINIDGVVPIWPQNFAVVGNDTISIIASTLNPLAESLNYIVEIDTSHLFNSPFRKQKIINQPGGVIEVKWSDWKNLNTGLNDPLQLSDSVVYFWRVALNETPIKWKNSSFQYIPNKFGWGQAKTAQFESNSFSGLNLNTLTGQREFTPIQLEISCLTRGDAIVQNQGLNAWYLGGFQQEYDICSFIPTFHVAVIDGSNLQPWGTRFVQQNGITLNPTHIFGNSNDNGGCRGRVENFFTFRQNNLNQLISFQDMLENEIPDGHYVLIYTPLRTRYDWLSTSDPQLPHSLLQTFESLGFDSLNTSTGWNRPNRPFIFLGRKGDPSFSMEVYSQNFEDISLDTVITGIDQIGFETSPMIGPVSEWKEVFWNYENIEFPSNDSISLKLSLINALGVQTGNVLIDIPSGDSLDVSNLINATEFPFAKLISTAKDTVNSTPFQLRNWHVLNSPLPDASIDAATFYNGLKQYDTLQEGQVGKFAIAVRNISGIGMDSLLVKYYITDQNQVIHPINYPRQDSLRAGDILIDTISFSTDGIVGLNFFNMEVNPHVPGSDLYDQPELTHINNLLQIPFYVIQENINPILDVTFDGRRIMNDEIISPRSNILITLKDENPYLIMDNDTDTSHFGIYLTYPSGTQKRIPFVDNNGNTVMEWTPANSQNKKFKITYLGEFEENGTYELSVQGSDKSGNLSGELEYKVSFKIDHESKITQVLNYPNPFSSNTRFVFTLTGAEVPEVFRIKVFTVTGKLVKEIDESDIGPINIGNNITSYAWDGKDEFGDQLANGVYLYTVEAKVNGESIPTMQTASDSYFKKGVGKMYLIR